MKPADVLYAVATGSKRLRALLTPAGLLLIVGLLFLVIFLGLATDRALGLPELLPGLLGWVVGVPLLAAGGILWTWCVVLFWRARGTLVPFNPPRELVAGGPYAWVRNPMLSGVFAGLFGLGFVLHSVAIVFVWTPLFVALNTIELRFVEEPELERRLGAAYTEYRQRVPRFIPKIPRDGRRGG